MLYSDDSCPVQLKEYKNVSSVAFGKGNQWYLYDRFSNEILKVEKIIVEILDDYFIMDKANLKNKYLDKYSQSELENAIATIENKQKTQNVLIKCDIPELKISQDIKGKNYLRNLLNQYMTQLILNVSEKCNLRCDYCLYGGGYKGKRKHNSKNEISLSLAQKAISFFIDHNSKSVDRYLSLYGGEPFLRPEILKSIIQYARKLAPDITIAITSNGTMLSSEMISFLEANNVFLTISLDGPKELQDKYRKFRNNKGSFDIVINNIKRIRNQNPLFYAKNLKINSVIVPFNGDIDELDSFFYNLPLPIESNPLCFSSGMINPDENSFSIVHDYDNYIQRYFQKIFEQYILHHTQKTGKEIYFAKAQLEKQIKMLYMRSLKRFDNYNYYYPNGICIPGVRSLFVSSNGDFYPCEKLYDHKDMIIGNIEVGFDEEKILEYLNEYCDNALFLCRDCWAYRLCSECFLSIRKNNSWNLEKRKENCLGVKSMWVSIMFIYVTILNKNENAFDYLFPGNS